MEYHAFYIGLLFPEDGQIKKGHNPFLLKMVYSFRKLLKNLIAVRYSYHIFPNDKASSSKLVQLWMLQLQSLKVPTLQRVITHELKLKNSFEKKQSLSTAQYSSVLT